MKTLFMVILALAVILGMTAFAQYPSKEPAQKDQAAQAPLKSVDGTVKVDGDKITFAPFKDKQKGDEKTYTAASGVKVVKGKFDKETKKVEAGDAIEGGLKNELFTNIGEKGVFAQIVTDDSKVTEIRVVRFGKKQKDQ